MPMLPSRRGESSGPSPHAGGRTVRVVHSSLPPLVGLLCGTGLALGGVLALLLVRAGALQALGRLSWARAGEAQRRDRRRPGLRAALRNRRPTGDPLDIGTGVQQRTCQIL